MGRWCPRRSVHKRASSARKGDESGFAWRAPDRPRPDRALEKSHNRRGKVRRGRTAPTARVSRAPHARLSPSTLTRVARLQSGAFEKPCRTPLPRPKTSSPLRRPRRTPSLPRRPRRTPPRSEGLTTASAVPAMPRLGRAESHSPRTRCERPRGALALPPNASPSHLLARPPFSLSLRALSYAVHH